MADKPEVNYVITIKSDVESSAPKKVASNNEGQPTEPDHPRTFWDFLNKGNAPLKVASTYALKYADLAITTHINRVELRTGSSTLQEKISYEYGMAKRLVGIGSTLVLGAFTGNPIAIVGGTMALVNMGVQHSIAQQNLNIAREVEGIGIQQANIRAGANGGRNGNF